MEISSHQLKYPNLVDATYPLTSTAAWQRFSSHIQGTKKKKKALFCCWREFSGYASKYLSLLKLRWHSLKRSLCEMGSSFTLRWISPSKSGLTCETPPALSVRSRCFQVSLDHSDGNSEQEFYIWASDCLCRKHKL